MTNLLVNAALGLVVLLGYVFDLVWAQWIVFAVALSMFLAYASACFVKPDPRLGDKWTWAAAWLLFDAVVIGILVGSGARVTAGLYAGSVVCLVVRYAGAHAGRVISDETARRRLTIRRLPPDGACHGWLV